MFSLDTDNQVIADARISEILRDLQGLTNHELLNVYNTMNMIELQDFDIINSERPRVGQNAFETFDDLIDLPDEDVFAHLNEEGLT